MKTIIVATDFSTEANNAMWYAADLAKAINARVILFNSYQLPEEKQSRKASPEEINKQLSENRRFLESVALKLSEQYKIQVDCWTNLTYVAEGLDELVKRSQAELVVMGMWKNAYFDSVFGNTTTFVIAQASYPVLVVPDDCHFLEMRKILFSWDSNNLVSAKTLELLKDFASGFGAKVQVFHVSSELEFAVHDQKEREVSLEQVLKGVPHVYRNLKEEDILNGIRRGVGEFKADLLVMVPHKSTTRRTFSYESITCEMALRTKVPLLALPSTC